MPDYAELIDTETWAFIERTEEFYPPETATLSISKQRAIYDAMCRAFFRGYPDGVSATDERYGGAPCRTYQRGSATPEVTVVYFHGGGFVVGGLDSHDDICAEICQRTGFRVISVGYRLCPEHKHPAPFDDCLAATRDVIDAYARPVVVAGDSAGGNLAAAVAAKLGGAGSIVGQALVYPGLGGDLSTGSHTEHAEAPMLTRADLEFYRSVRFDGEEPAGDPTYAPLCATDFSGLPPTVIFSAQCDPLSDDGRVYRDNLTAAGVRAKWFNEAGLVHGYLRARTTVGRARESFERILAAIEALGRGRWPY